MSHLGLTEPQSSGTLSTWTVYSWTANGVVDTAGTQRFTTAAHLGNFVVTDVWWFHVDGAAGGGITFSLGTAAALYNQIVNAQTSGVIDNGYFNFFPLVATASANGPALPPSTAVFSRVPSSTLLSTDYYQVFVGGFYTGARG